MWTKKQLKQTIESKLSDFLLVVASNRQPYGHMLRDGKIVCQREPGGLVTALDPVMQTSQGLWVAAGGSSYDRMSVDKTGKVQLPPENPSYSLKRIFLSKEERDSYYYGYSNEGLWPLCHIAYTRPTFLAADWESYRKVNQKFAEAILEEVGERKAFVWVQDFHLILLAKYLKEKGPSNVITSLFWHIPWPNSETFSTCPQKREILEALMSFDLLGFQIRYHADNFLAAVDLELESRIDREKTSVSYQNHETLVRAFPISVDFQTISSATESPEGQARGQAIKEELMLEGRKLIIGVDRIDYTKGLPDKFRAIDRLLEKYPEFKEKITYFQLGQISRLHIQRYKDLNEELNTLMEHINWKHSQGSWVPIIFRRTYMSYSDILSLYRTADICIVSSLHDGMNLVAKEFIAARSDLRGILLLSQFTGASRELADSILINPYDTESFAEALAGALSMPEPEIEKRMQKMREVVAQNNIYRWAGKVLSQLLKFEFQEV
ncbi:MAG: trehalose-6-phosphate synthase [Candidatus Omnitrophica bacterium]|nr:trehalose-6-phosphate synthase [Candidatus Omnitrophota bacterium]